MSVFQLNTDETCGALMIFAEVAKKINLSMYNKIKEYFSSSNKKTMKSCNDTLKTASFLTSSKIIYNE